MAAGSVGKFLGMSLSRWQSNLWPLFSPPPILLCFGDHDGCQIPQKFEGPRSFFHEAVGGDTGATVTLALILTAGGPK
jgi:hypothetical protein